MSEAAVRIFVCFEPDHAAWAERLDEWTRTNADLSAYAARVRLDVADAASLPVREKIAGQIEGADVLVCLIGQTTFADRWVNWEIETCKSARRSVGRVGVLLQELYQVPPPLVDGGAIFVRFKQDLVARAIRWAAAERRAKGDFTLLDE